jgi:hypothetical protein
MSMAAHARNDFRFDGRLDVDSVLSLERSKLANRVFVVRDDREAVAFLLSQAKDLNLFGCFAETGTPVAEGD